MGGGSKSSSKKVIKETINRNEKNTITNTKNERNVLDQTDVINRVQYGDRASKGIVDGANSVNAGYAIYGLQNLDWNLNKPSMGGMVMRPAVCMPCTYRKPNGEYEFYQGGCC